MSRMIILFFGKDWRIFRTFWYRTLTDRIEFFFLSITLNFCWIKWRFLRGWIFVWVDSFTFCVGKSSFSFEAWRDEIENVWDRVLSLGFRPFSSEIFSSLTISRPTFGCPVRRVPEEIFSSPLSSPSKIGFRIDFMVIKKRIIDMKTRLRMHYSNYCLSYYLQSCLYQFHLISHKLLSYPLFRPKINPKLTQNWPKIDP